MPDLRYKTVAYSEHILLLVVVLIWLQSGYRDTHCLQGPIHFFQLSSSKIINFNERKSKTARRSEIRYNVKCKAKFNHSQERFEVLNVSKEGLKIKANEFLPVNTSLTCRILIAEFEVIELTCTTKWNFDEKLYGLKIENSNHPHWLKFINHIENKTWNKNERRAA